MSKNIPALKELKYLKLPYTHNISIQNELERAN